MSKARKRHRQPWWKRAHTDRQSVKRWMRRVRSGEIKMVSFVSELQKIYPKGVGS